jgi:hypothetical protein
VSAHYIVDRNGDIYQMVDDADVANHCRGANQNSIGIEHVGLESQAMTGSQRDSSAALTKFLMNRYGIDAKNSVLAKSESFYPYSRVASDVDVRLLGSRGRTNGRRCRAGRRSRGRRQRRRRKVDSTADRLISAVSRINGCRRTGLKRLRKTLNDPSSWDILSLIVLNAGSVELIEYR